VLFRLLSGSAGKAAAFCVNLCKLPAGRQVCGKQNKSLLVSDQQGRQFQLSAQMKCCSFKNKFINSTIALMKNI
jgi:hypothetical protein